MTDEEKAELERRIASQRGTIRVYNNKLKSRLEQVERLKQENKELREENAKLKKELKIPQRCWQDQWHYPSKGEYPKEGENVLCYCKCRTEIKFCCVGHIVVGGDNKIRWWSSNRSEKLNVYAWKEIVLPKEIKESE